MFVAAPHPAPEPLVYRNLVYARVGERELHLDLYLPPEQTQPVPLIIWIHGGGWMAGSTVNAKRLPFPREGFALASVEYRLSKEAKWPAQIEDCKAAVRWLRAHAPEFQLDPDRFGVIGHSAGGHLSALVGTTGDTGYFSNGEGPFVSSAVQAVCSMSGPSDFSRLDPDAVPGARIRHNAPDSPEARLFGAPIQLVPEKVKEANPASYIDRHDPPFCLIHGSRDLAVTPEQSVLLFDALERKRVKSELHEMVGQGHDLVNSGTLSIALRFFDRYLRPRVATRGTSARRPASARVDRRKLAARAPRK